MSTEKREPVIEPALPVAEDPAAEAGCASFESTLLLMDGALSGFDRSDALKHVEGCPTCGPLVMNWRQVSTPMVAMFEQVAEAAKPDLSKVSDRVMERLGPSPSARPVVVATPGPIARFFGSLQPWLALGAATAAIGLVLYPLLTDAPATDGTNVVATNTPVVAPVPAPVPVPVPEPAPVLALEDEPEDPEDTGSLDEEATEGMGVVVRRVAFEGADGMVFRAPDSDLTVIWVNEYDGT